MRTETPAARAKGIRKDQSVWKHIGCNGKIPTRVQGRVSSNGGEPLEVIGDDHPRYMVAHARASERDRIRLNVQYYEKERP